jgi:hypothetical protein
MAKIIRLAAALANLGWREAMVSLIAKLLGLI